MIPKTLIQLAKSNDPLLAKYSKRWTEKHKGENPVTTAIGIFNARIYGWASIIFCTVISMIGSHYMIYPLALLPCSLIVGILVTAIQNRKRYKNMLAFCDAINILELKIGRLQTRQDDQSVFGAEVVRKWQNESIVAREGESILFSEALEVKQLQEFPWRKSQADKLRARLEKNIALIAGVAPIRENMGYYF